MATLSHADSRRMYSWWWDSHISPKNSKWLQENLQENNVGTNFSKPTIEYTAEEYSELMSINLDSAFHLCQLAYPLLKASGMGSIVFISSVVGLVSLGIGSVYAACKAAINQLTKNLACEWAKDNIRSNCVVPWATRTPLIEHIFNDQSPFGSEEIDHIRQTWAYFFIRIYSEQKQSLDNK